MCGVYNHFPQIINITRLYIIFSLILNIPIEPIRSPLPSVISRYNSDDYLSNCYLNI